MPPSMSNVAARFDNAALLDDAVDAINCLTAFSGVFGVNITGLIRCFMLPAEYILIIAILIGY